MKRRDTMLIVVLGSSLVFCSTTRGGQTGDDTTSRVRGMLSQGYEQAPTSADVGMMGEGVDRALIEIYRDESGPMLQRMRAMDLLGAFPSEELKTLLDHEAARTDLPPALARRVLATTVRAFAEHEPAFAERVWQANSASTDPTVRFDAAQTLGKIRPSAELIAVAKQRATAETDAAVRAELDRQVAATKPR